MASHPSHPRPRHYVSVIVIARNQALTSAVSPIRCLVELQIGAGLQGSLFEREPQDAIPEKTLHGPVRSLLPARARLRGDPRRQFRPGTRTHEWVAPGCGCGRNRPLGCLAPQTKPRTAVAGLPVSP